LLNQSRPLETPQLLLQEGRVETRAPAFARKADRLVEPVVS
jgi:hypothetical protein